MGDKGDAVKALSRNLHEAIERVRKDVERVEFWADAVAGFSQPVPDYDRAQGNVWVPAEQGAALSAKRRGTKNRANPERNTGSAQRAKSRGK